jgi:hypothetical protein
MNSGNVLQLPRAGGQVDGVQRDEGSSVAWSASSITSRGEGEHWPEELEWRWLQSSTKASICYMFKQMKNIRWCARVWEGGRERPEGGGGVPEFRRNRRDVLTGARNSDEEFLWLGGVSGEREKIGEGGDQEGFYRGAKSWRGG